MSKEVVTIKKSGAVDQQYCPKCRKTLKQSTNFYLHKNGEYDEMCRKCLTMHIDPWDKESFMWLLERFDFPYIKGEWDIIRDRSYAKDPIKFSGQSVFGKYIAKMKLKQYKEHNTFADTAWYKEHAKLQAEQSGLPIAIEEERLNDMKQAYENGEISEAEYMTYATVSAPEETYESPDSREALAAKLGIKIPTGQTDAGADLASAYPANSNFEEVELVDVGADLTDEDKIYLAMKWGRLYRADEWVALEKLYNEFMNSFDIQGAARLDTLKKICKTSLKMDQAIDAGDIDSYQKLSRVYDALMKSAKFTEAQNKEEKGDFVDSVGEIVSYCERVGDKIPRFKIEEPLDIVDKIIKDLKVYNKTLIYEDKALATEIETYLKNRIAQEQMRRERENGNPTDITNEDFIEYQEAYEKLKEKDKIEMKGDSK